MGGSENISGGGSILISVEVLLFSTIEKCKILPISVHFKVSYIVEKFRFETSI
jgi:hypothetical protein